MAVRRPLASEAAASLGVSLYFALVSIDFLVLTNPLDASAALTFAEDGGRSAEIGREASDALKANLGRLLYVYVAVLAFVQRARVLPFMRQNLHFAAILAVLLLGVLYSVDPAEVVTNTIQIGVGTALAIVFAVSRRSDRRTATSLATAILLPLALVHLSSVILFQVNALDLNAYLAGEARYGGMSGGPNSAGGEAVLGIWAASTLALDPLRGRGLRLAALLSLCAFGFSLSVAGSGTALIAAAVVAVAMLAMRALARVPSRYRVPTLMAALLAALLGAGGWVAGTTDVDLAGRLAGSVGKDTTFTGRTDLWATGRAAFAERPLLGWSMDSHASVKSERRFDIPFRHYHNGFVDTLVAGGALLGALVLYELLRYFQLFVRSGPRGFDELALAVPVVVLVVLNLTEYSLLRPLSSFYVAFQCAWCLLWLRAQTR